MFTASMQFDLGEDVNALREMVHRWAQERLKPMAAEIDRANLFPSELWREMGELGLLGITVEEDFGGAGLGYLAHVVAVEEVARASASVSLSYGAHSNLCVNQIRLNGTETQKAKYLPALVSGDHVGALAMSEAGAGSDVVSMKLRAEKRNDHYRLNGNKYWITNGSTSQVAVVWAKLDGVVRGFLVDTDTKGFEGRPIKNKFSLRASDTSELVLEDVRVPKSALLPGVEGLKGPLSCLTQARYGIAFGAVGAAQAAYDEACRYSKMRIMFDKPIARFQLVQNKLVWMANEITKAQLMCWQLGKMKEAGTMQHYHVSMAKRNSCWMALECCRLGRDILGANGITDEYQVMRHMCNLESVITYEGTHDIHALIVGRQLTGEDAIM